ncbi:M3 family metallopeptidase [Paralimibaculum aggregatum]|uniref:M3 family metallopeptidase n=1 Tax=Paralimibaculum aggregatum TaxID=3036245 RepID=A0ABQ6LSD1_9RHOB|nr:M3 family metallopeptidase [Limibaculum sp. NKW23]GMG84982.1 M3 family metallopeptidase [Limibaculum sp. NKW23]
MSESVNPAITDWTGPFGLPDFGAIAPADFEPAFAAAMGDHNAEIAAIRDNAAAPDFANTIEALERAGERLDRVASIFFTLAASDTSAELQAIERRLSPQLAAHGQAILTDAALWARVKAVTAEGLGPEAARVTELAQRRFRRAGADLDAAGRARMREIGTRLAELGTAFAQAVLKDEQDWSLALGEDDMAGLPDFLVAAARAEAAARGADAAGVITLSRSSVEPFLALSDRRDLREAAWRAWTGRGESGSEGGAGGTWPIIAETLALRDEKAKLLGFESFADFRLAEEMAKTPDRVRGLLMQVWRPARAKAEADRAALEALAQEAGMNDPVEAWDWRYLAEKQRKKLHDLDEAALKPYLALDNVIAAAFDVAGRLFGLEFREVEGLPLPHRDARAWEVTRGGAHVGLFVGDYFARSSKRSGAWASALRRQQKLTEPHRPIILNTCNFAKGAPTLLSFDDARTLFHEFGHALHGLLSDVTYPSISGTAVARDFVELPSQLYEHWLAVPEVLAKHARHVETGAPMPEALVARLKAAETFGQGFATVEYLGSALVDLEMHGPRAAAAAADPAAFEAAVLAEIGMPREIAMRHRSPHFLHVFAGSGYASGYYSYMWSEVMDADAFRAFEETGDVFDRATAAKLEAHVLSAGGRAEPEAAYLGFRGAMPGPEALLEGRGLADAGTGAGADAGAAG